MSELLKQSNWIKAEVFQKYVVSGKRFGWRSCVECRHFDRFDGNRCRLINHETTNGASCDFWVDISL